MHTAQVLTQIMPVLVNGASDDSTKNSYVHYDLPPLLASVFVFSARLKMKEANDKLQADNYKSVKPFFSVNNLSSSTNCVVLTAEFKAAEQNSYVKSNLVKLAKQMKTTLNRLIKNGVSKPKVYGIHFE